MNSWSIIVHAFPQLLTGLERTVGFSVIAILLASIIGLIAALCKLSRFAVLRGISWVYVEVFRGTPLLVQLLFIALGLPTICH